MGQTRTGTYGSSIAWVPRAEIDPRGHGHYESLVGVKFVSGPSLASGVLARRPRFPAWRCANRKHVEFSYDERVVLR